MIQAEAKVAKPEGLKKLINTSFEICKSKKSSWIKDGTGPNTTIPAQNMHTNRVLFVDMMSRLYLGEEFGYRLTQYVPGASTIYADDYFEDKKGNLVLEPVNKESAQEKGYQFRPGLRSQGFDVNNTDTKWGAGYKMAMAKNICFENGRLELSKYGSDPMLLKFINEHEQNKFAPRAKENMDPSRLTLFMFQPMILENKAARTPIVESWDAGVEAMKFVDSLREKKGAGYAYNEFKMNAVLAILEQGIGLAEGAVNQKFEVIARASRADGETFMRIIEVKMNQYRASVGAAETLEVLTYAGEEAKITADGKKTTIYSFKKGTEKDSMVDEIALYFLGTEEGKNNYRELKRLTENAKIAALKK